MSFDLKVAIYNNLWKIINTSNIYLKAKTKQIFQNVSTFKNYLPEYKRVDKKNNYFKMSVLSFS